MGAKTECQILIYSLLYKHTVLFDLKLITVVSPQVSASQYQGTIDVIDCAGHWLFISAKLNSQLL